MTVLHDHLSSHNINDDYLRYVDKEMRGNATTRKPE